MKLTITASHFRDSLLAQIDLVGDAARLSVVGDAARIEEYRRALEHASAYRDAGFAGDVPSAVASWAKAKTWTPQQAAEDILAASARWYGALDKIRELRLQAKEDVRNATAAVQAEQTVAAFQLALASALQGVT